MDLLFLAFANSRDTPLATLREEDDQVHAILSRRVAEKHFMVHRDSHATLQQMADALIRAENREQRTENHSDLSDSLTTAH